MNNIVANVYNSSSIFGLCVAFNIGTENTLLIELILCYCNLAIHRLQLL